MTEFTSIKQAKENLKGNICGIVVKIGSLKSGTAAKGDWSMKVITIDDGSDMVDIAAFGESEYSKFVIGAKYEIENPWWKMKDNKLSVNFGQFCKIQQVSEAPNQTMMDNNTSKEEQTTIDAKLEKFSEEDLTKIQFSATQMFRIKKEVEKIIKTYEINPNGGMLWEMTKIIYNESFGRFLGDSKD